MPDLMSHEDAHKAWSAEQLIAFRAMNSSDRLSMVKSGALEHWTEAARNAALDILGEGGKRTPPLETPKALKFEPAFKMLAPQATRSPRLDHTLLAAAIGWAVIMIAATGRAYGLY